MAYAAVVSVKQTIHHFLNSNPNSNVSSSTQATMEFSLKEMELLQQLLRKLDDSSLSNSSRKRLDALDGKMREVVFKLEDIVEFHESESENYGSDGEKVMQEISIILEALKKMKEEYTEELDNPLSDHEEEQEDDDDATIDFGEEKVLIREEIGKVKSYLLQKTKRPDDFGVFSFVGSVGSGRTAFAYSIYDDLYIRQEQPFDCGSGVIIGPEYDFKEIPLSILANMGVDQKFLVNLWETEDDKSIGEYLYSRLKGKRYIVMLDDVCDTEVWAYLKSSFPVENNGSIILLTTALQEVALSAQSFFIYGMQVHEDNQLWSYICASLFDLKGESCPPSLEEVGKKIAKNCQGLCLTFAKVLLHLSQAQKMPEYWKELAEDKTNPIYMVADEISEMKAMKQVYFSTQDASERQAFEIAEITVNGTPELFKHIKTKIFPERLFPKMTILSLYGMAGIGKTTIANEIFKDPLILCHFDHSVWITLGQKYDSQEILIDILAQLHPDIDKSYLKGDVKLAKDLCMQLSNKKCLIVMDDVWSKEPLHCLEKLFPNIKGETLVTTRLTKVAEFGYSDQSHKIRLLCEEDSWRLFCANVFGEDQSCPSELNKVGKKIVKKCEGLPLMIVKVANVLHKADKTPDFWNEVAEEENLVFKKVHDEISKTLLLSYYNIPQHLRACFLYMGVFPLDYEIPRSKLARLWAVEGFLEQNISLTPKDPFAECLLEFDDKNVVLVPQKGSNFEVKACRLHCVYWHLSNDLATKNNIFHGFISYTKSVIEGVKSQRRLCIRNNTLLGIKKVFDSIAVLNSTARSLLCTGAYHKYQVPIFFGLRLLRVLDALTIRFYEFPMQVLKLFRLRYLAVTCNGVLPSSISKLWNLQILIVGKHLSIKYPGAHLYLPIEIWDMKNLKHLQIMGSNLPNPTCDVDLILPNLLTLSDVSAHNFTKRILKRIRNLKKLGIQIELAFDDDGKQFHCLNRISRLGKLESLKCVVMNPKLMYKVVAAPPRSMFPSSLRKLHLSGLGYPWEYMSMIGSLRNLEVLKLTCYAFRGPTWEAYNSCFWKLKYLLIEDVDLVCWKTKATCFGALEHLCINYCFVLEELPYFSTLYTLKVVDCNPWVIKWAKESKERQLREPFGLESPFQVHVQTSWDAKGNFHFASEC